MKSTQGDNVHNLPLSELRARADRARALLRDVRARVESPLARREDRAVGLRAIEEALEAIERHLPGLMERPHALLARTIRDLAPNERRVLSQAIDAERAARERLTRLLGEVSPEHVEDALARVEAQESMTAELSALFRLVERARAAPVVA
jgi:hypothetical protein